MEDYLCDCTATISVKALIMQNRKILLLRDSHGHLDLPGGRMRCGESIPDAIRREIKEELGASGNCDQIPLYAFAWNNQPKKAHGLILVYRFLLREDVDTVSSRENDKSVVWVDSGDFQQQKFPSFFSDGYHRLVESINLEQN
jgi:ADP-ribose pyrophosphatase YjhB (NUDIX family)